MSDLELLKALIELAPDRDLMWTVLLFAGADILKFAVILGGCLWTASAVVRMIVDAMSGTTRLAHELDGSSVLTHRDVEQICRIIYLHKQNRS